MRTSDFWKIGVLGLLLIPLLGSTCAEEKTIEFVLHQEAEANFQARGTDDLGSDEYDLKAEVDLAKIASDNGVDVNDIREVTFRGLCYRITRADPTPERRIENGVLLIQFRQAIGQTVGARDLVPLGTNFSAPASAVTDWIDITELVDQRGVDEMNAFFDRCLTAAQTGTTADHPVVYYDWDGDSLPLGDTNFDWKVKVQVNIIPTVTAEIPSF